MSFERYMVRPVQILRASTSTDRNHATVTDWESPTTTALNGWLDQRSSAESNGIGLGAATSSAGRESTSTGQILFVPAGTDIRKGDRVIVDATTYEVDGNPNRPWSPRGEHHVEVALVEVSG